MGKRIGLRMTAALLAVFTLLTLPQRIVADPVEPPKETSLYSKACVLMDGESGRVLYGKNEALALANASTTKILTAIVCLEQAELTDVVTASKKAASQPKVHLGMREGEQFYVQDLLYAMMLESFNDCAMALAEHVGGSMEGFAALLNEKAAQIGCTDTYFITPNGLDAEDDKGFHHTTATDLARLMKYCCWDSPKAAEFLRITQTASHSFTNLSGKSYAVSNKNAFLSMMPEAISGKTGFTSAAGYCYVGAIESEGRRYTIALLACGWPNHKTYKWSDAKTLFRYGMEHYRIEEIAFPENTYSVEVINGKRADAALADWGRPVVLTAGMELPEAVQAYLLSEEEAFSYELELPGQVCRAVNAGDIVGKMQCYLNGECVAEVEICLNEGSGQWDFRGLLSCFWNAYFTM